MRMNIQEDITNALFSIYDIKKVLEDDVLNLYLDNEEHTVGDDLDNVQGLLEQMEGYFEVIHGKYPDNQHK
tara:strand:- start:325 stop:537 length:213 start_codon:yes stop_codon:yes gene_type:complete